METTIVNFCGGPGSGKSTLSSDLFRTMKQKMLSVEIVPEVAKKLTWQKHHNVLQCQPKVFGDQLWDIKHLVGQVAYVLVDSPLFLTAVYHDGSYGEYLNKLAVDVFKNNFNNMTFFVKREKEYVAAGRNQTFEEAKEVDNKVLEVLHANSIPYYTVLGNADGLHKVLSILGI